MTTSVSFYFVDVFASHPLAGNPLSLVPDADGLDETTGGGRASAPTTQTPSQPAAPPYAPPLMGQKIEHVRRGVIAAPGVARLREQASRLWLAETG